MTDSISPKADSVPPGWQGRGLFSAWWEGDSLQDLAVLPGFEAVRTEDVALLARLINLPPSQVEARLAAEHHAYVALVDGQAAAYGWSATREAEIGEHEIDFSVPLGNRYLWDFATLEAWRGRGLYPRLLLAIVRAERAEASRFWIGYDLDNVASARGLSKTGFRLVGEVGTNQAGQLKLLARGPLERARAAADMLGLELVASG